MNHKINTKKGFIVFFVLFILINFTFLGTWFKYGVQSSIQQGYTELEREIKNDIIDNIEKNIENNNEVNASSLFKNIAAKYNLFLIVKDSNNKIIFNNTTNISQIEYLMPYIVSIESKTYILSVGKANEINTVSITKKFMAFEIIFTICIMILALLIANEILLKPISLTIKDIKNYKFGIKPNKRKISNEIDYIQNEFVDLTKSLEKEHEEQNRIISAISHDIKTPLTSIIGYSDLLINTKLKKDEKEALLKKIYNKALNMKEIVSDFDDYLLANKDRTYNYTNISLKDYLDKIKFEYKDDLKDKGIKFEISNKAKTNNITIDIGKFNRVFSNLITNSIRYLEKNGKIIIECFDDAENIYFKVIDNGKGVEVEHLDKIFNPLFTTDRSRKISGLGLSITKEIIQMHGGKIKAMNNKNKGLTIEFSIKKSLDTNKKNKYT